MKKIGITLLVTLMIGIFNVQAEEKQEADKVNISLDTTTEYETIKVAAKVPKGLKDAVTKQLFYPEYAKNKNIEGQVYLRITVDNSNQVKIVEMNATTPCLGKYVKKQLASTFVKNPGCKPGQVYIMKVNFDLIN